MRISVDVYRCHVAPLSRINGPGASETEKPTTSRWLWLSQETLPRQLLGWLPLLRRMSEVSGLVSIYWRNSTSWVRIGSTVVPAGSLRAAPAQAASIVILRLEDHRHSSMDVTHQLCGVIACALGSRTTCD